MMFSPATLKAVAAEYKANGGDLSAAGHTGLRAEAQLSVFPGSQGVPVSGKIQATYEGAGDTVRMGPSYIEFPHSRLDA